MTNKTTPRRLFRQRINSEIKQEIWCLPCAVCGQPPKHTQVDHIIPVKHGGGCERSNLQPLCRWCNGIKGGRMMTNQQIAVIVQRRNGVAL